MFVSHDKRWGSRCAGLGWLNIEMMLLLLVEQIQAAFGWMCHLCYPSLLLTKSDWMVGREKSRATGWFWMTLNMLSSNMKIKRNKIIYLAIWDGGYWSAHTSENIYLAISCSQPKKASWQLRSFHPNRPDRLLPQNNSNIVLFILCFQTALGGFSKSCYPSLSQ